MDNSRRDFFKTATVPALAAAAFIGAPMALAAAEEGSGGALTEHTLPDLPYAFDALEPFIDAKTMQIHHDKHHQGYVNGLNAAEKALAEARAKGDFALIQHYSRSAAFNGGGHFLHSMFWKVMAPAGKGGGGEPTGELADMIARDFGSFEGFKAHFGAAAKAVEGSGWGLVHYRPADGRLLVLQGENQHKLSPWGSMPVMGIDVWEHAYYLNYQNNRAAYVDNWWNVVNWEQVAANVKALQASA
ncbi:MAG: superoxide dismutase [Candidatus Hydrogenedens sp.]|nr:superoxide dismutase [Candidatus Hydrogenedens sp.]